MIVGGPHFTELEVSVLSYRINNKIQVWYGTCASTTLDTRCVCYTHFTNVPLNNAFTMGLAAATWLCVLKYVCYMRLVDYRDILCW